MAALLSDNDSRGSRDSESDYCDNSGVGGSGSVGNRLGSGGCCCLGEVSGPAVYVAALQCGIIESGRAEEVEAVSAGGELFGDDRETMISRLLKVE